MTATTAFKILTAEQWDDWQSRGVFSGAPIDVRDGFVHLSVADQVEGTISKHFAGQTDLVLVEIDLDSLGGAVRWELSRGGARFPHVYAPIPLEAIVATRTMNDGGYNLATAFG